MVVLGRELWGGDAGGQHCESFAKDRISVCFVIKKFDSMMLTGMYMSEIQNKDKIEFYSIMFIIILQGQQITYSLSLLSS